MTEWRKAGESPRTMMARAAEIQPFAQVVGDIPDEHVITVAERRVSVDYPIIIQNNMNTDTVDLVLDGEWDGMSVVCYIGHPGDLGEFEWEGKPFTLPVYDMTGPIDVTVVGLSADGKTRLVTVEAKGVMNVIKSGEFEGSVPPEDQPDLLGQILAAKGDAEDAAEAANSAATSATSAASSANSAASSANTATSSANSAATKANSAAVDAQNAYDTLQPYMATIDSCANILHREVGPDAVVTADDSFPCKPVEMVVYGNTVQNLWRNPSGTSQGVTVTSNADGSFSVSGTAPADATNSVVVNAQSYVLKPSTQYTFSCDKAITFGTKYGFIVDECRSDGTVIKGYYLSLDNSTTKVTFTTGTGANFFRFGVSVAAGATASGTYRVMLNEGSEAEPWCPPGLNSVGDGGSVEVVTAGKNLIGFTKATTYNGVTFQPTDDGGISVTGTNTGDHAPFAWLPIAGTDSPGAWGDVEYTPIPPGNYVMSCDGPSIYSARITVYKSKDVFSEVYVDSVTKQASFTLPESYYCLAARVVGSMTVENSGTMYLQLEKGSTATDFEPYKGGTTTPIDLQGHTLNALPDGTRDELHIDGGGNVVLEKRTWSDVFDGTEGWVDSIDRYGLYNGATFATTPEFIDKQMADTLPTVPFAGGKNGIRLFSPKWVDAGIASMQGDLAGFKAWLGNNNTTLIYKLLEPQTIDLGTITPPTMAAPNVTAYVADDTPAEMTLDYVRDVNIVHSRLEERVAALELASATS